MLDMLRSEFFRINRRWMPRVLVLILAAVIGLIYLLTWVAAQSSQFDAEERADLLDTLRLETVVETGLGVGGLFGSLFVIILAASTVATEYGWGTIRALLPRSAGRVPLLAAKLIVLALFAALVVIVSFVAALIASAVITQVEGLEGGLGSGFVTDALLGIVRTWFTMLPYLALAFMVALLAKSSAAGISVGTAVLFLEGQILSLISAAGGIFERLPELFLSENVQAILTMNGGGTSDADLPNPWRAAAVLAIYTVAFLTLAVWRFRRRDVTVG